MLKGLVGLLLIPLAAGRTMNSLIKNSKLVIIEKCDRPQEEMPERVLDEVTAFIGLASPS